MTDHTVCVGSVWTFLDPTAIVHEFQARHKGLVTRCEFKNSERQFIINCQMSQQEEAINAFTQLLRDYSNRDTAGIKVGDPFEHPQAVRLPETRIQKIHGYFDQANTLDEFEQLRVGGPTSEELINHETLCTEWKPRTTRTVARNLFSSTVLETIEKKSKCRIEWRQDLLIILGGNQHEVDDAFAMLGTTEKMHLNATGQRLNFDFYHDEAQIGHRFRFTSPKNTVDQFLLTLETFPSEFYEVTMVTWDPSSLQFRQVARDCAAIRFSDYRTNPWAEMVRFMHGDERYNPKYWLARENMPSVVNFPISLPAGEINRISQWAQEIDERPPDPFLAWISGTEEPGDEIEAYVRTRMKVKSRAPLAEPMSTERLALAGVPSQQHMVLASLPSGRASNTSLNDSLTHHLQAELRSIKSSGSELFLDTDLTETSKSPRRILDLHDSVERLRVDDEENLRHYRSQNKLRSGRRTGKEATTNLFSLLQTAALRILDVSRASTNAAACLEVLLGKLFIKAKTVPLEYRCHRSKPALAFAPGEWSTMLPTLTGIGSASTSFSERMTASWEDARFLMDLPHPTMRQMFKVNNQLARAYYEVDCLDNGTGLELMIEFNGDKTVAIRASQSTVGTINLHFPKRVWDARLVVSAGPEWDSRNIGSFSSIVNELWIHTPDGSAHESPEILFSRKGGSHIVIKSVKLKREVICRARGTDQDVHLHLTQVQDLRITDYPEDNFCAYALPEEDMIRQGLLWWEARLSSKTVIRELQGGHTHNDESVRDAIRRLFETTQLVVTNIDSVGYTSQMPIDGSSMKSQNKETISGSRGTSRADS